MTRLRLQVRPSDCDSFGHVNNAVYVSHLQHALAESLAQMGYARDWDREGEYCWELKLLTAEYRQPARFGDELRASLWPLEAVLRPDEGPDLTQLAFGFEIKRPAEEGEEGREQAIFRARSVWQRSSRENGQPVTLPESLLAGFPRAGGAIPRPFHLPPDVPEAKNYYWKHSVNRSEVGPNGQVHPQAVYHWLEESLFDASAQAGWPAERRLAAGFLTLQTRHDTEFTAFPGAGDTIQVTSRVIEVRRLRGTWLHEMRKLPGQELLARDYSTGVFLNPEGRPTTPPMEMMNEIQFG